uniref:Uncharacterized protein n=1 Tax=Oncorhynchus mykiss TaxID=8022 RepID=A0A8K9WL24_ONCMY
MKWCVVLLALLQSLCCSGKWYTILSGVELNFAAGSNRASTHASVHLILFIHETNCLKSSGEDSQRCTFRLTQVVSLNCGQDTAESSSEENFTSKRQQLNALPCLCLASEAPLFPSHSFSRQEMEPLLSPLGISFGNHLEYIQ